MHHYPFHIGDYLAHTRHLTLMQDLAYRRLLDLVYLSEGPLEGPVENLARRISMPRQKTDVEKILAEFFDLREGAWHNDRAMEEIAHYRDKREKAAKAGRASANRRSTGDQQALDVGSTDEQPTRTKTKTNPPQPPLPGGGAPAAPAPEPDPQAEALLALQAALSATNYRGGMPDMPRRFELLRRAGALLATGLTPADVAILASLDAARAETPGALLAHWFDGEPPRWREVIDEEASKAKEAAARSRARSEA